LCGEEGTLSEQAEIGLSTKKPSMKIRIIKHEVVPDCGSHEVRFPDGRPSKYFYFENLPGRRLQPGRVVEQAVAEQEAKTFARQEQDNLDSQ
jgi:hypothetical protein